MTIPLQLGTHKTKLKTKCLPPVDCLLFCCCSCSSCNKRSWHSQHAEYNKPQHSWSCLISDCNIFWLFSCTVGSLLEALWHELMIEKDYSALHSKHKLPAPHFLACYGWLCNGWLCYSITLHCLTQSLSILAPTVTLHFGSQPTLPCTLWLVTPHHDSTIQALTPNLLFLACYGWLR